MSGYTGIKCIVCGEVFKDDDDIVVCPECGTPYHRKCYEKNGKCINTELHEKHETFIVVREKTEEYNSAIKCPNCGAENEPLAVFCKNCGKALFENQNIEQEKNSEGNYTEKGDRPFFNIDFDAPLCGINPEENFDGVTAQEISDFVGPNANKFLTMFKYMKDSKIKFSFNTPALFVPQLYYSYRKMLPFAIIIMVIQLVLGIPASIEYLQNISLPYFEIPDYVMNIDVNSQLFTSFEFLCSVASYIMMFGLSFFANYIYYRYTIYKIKKIKKIYKNENIREKIKSKGGVSIGYVFIIPAIALIASVILSFFLIY